jgi:hypothetical protein
MVSDMEDAPISSRAHSGVDCEQMRQARELLLEFLPDFTSPDDVLVAIIKRSPVRILESFASPLVFRVVDVVVDLLC